MRQITVNAPDSGPKSPEEGITMEQGKQHVRDEQ